VLFGERQNRFSLPDGFLAGVPPGNRLYLLDGELRKNQVSESCLPGDGFRLVEGKLENTRLVFAERRELLFYDCANSREADTRIRRCLTMVSVHFSLACYHGSICVHMGRKE